MKGSVLVIDDENAMREALSEALARGGFMVSTASNGQEGLKKLNSTSYSAIITDLKMPAFGGLDLLKEVKKRAPHTPVIMITAYGTIDSAVEAMKLGACDYIQKPFSVEVLERALSKALLKSKATVENNSGPASPKDGNYKERIVTADPEMKRLIELARNVAASKATVLINGESGTGKELFANFIHSSGPRAQGPFVAVNCASIPEGLLESELFGHEKGAFTGAVSRRLGKFELANTGTLLLDEISEMAMPLQAKLLRVLQDYRIDRIGAKEPVKVDVRIIATTNRDLAQAVEKASFREDLYYRLNVIPINIPPLRERKADIALLANHFIEKHSKLNGRKRLKLAEPMSELLMKYTWRGNVRELENAIERAVLLCDDDMLLPKHLFIDGCDLDNGSVLRPATICSVKEMEKELIIRTLEETKGNRTRAAKLLGISIRTLRNKLKEYRSHNAAKP